MKDIQKYKVRLPKYPNKGIQRTDGSFSESYDKDFYINVLIEKENTLSDYVNVYVDPSRLEIQRQSINPYYIELGFFKNVTSILKENTNNKNSIEEKSYNYNLKINGLPSVSKKQLENGETEFTPPPDDTISFMFKLEKMGLRSERGLNTAGRNIIVYIKQEDKLRITRRFQKFIKGRFIEIKNTSHLDGIYNVTALWINNKGLIAGFYLNSEDNESFYNNFITEDTELKTEESEENRINLTSWEFDLVSGKNGEVYFII